MQADRFSFFKLAMELNKELHSELLKKKLHFRGNKNSISLISLEKDTAEKGISNIKTKEKALEILSKPITLDKPRRKTPEKVLQAWLIYNSMLNNGYLSFKANLLFITSELVIQYNTNEFLDKRDIRNDILAIDEENTLCIIELKSSRTNDVKKQTIEFEKVVKNKKDFFYDLIFLKTNRKWNQKIRKIAVWPATKGTPRVNKFQDVEVVNYSEIDNGFSFK